MVQKGSFLWGRCRRSHGSGIESLFFTLMNVLLWTEVSTTHSKRFYFSWLLLLTEDDNLRVTPTCLGLVWKVCSVFEPSMFLDDAVWGSNFKLCFTLLKVQKAPLLLYENNIEVKISKLQLRIRVSCLPCLLLPQSQIVSIHFCRKQRDGFMGEAGEWCLGEHTSMLKMCIEQWMPNKGGKKNNSYSCFIWNLDPLGKINCTCIRTVI